MAYKNSCNELTRRLYNYENFNEDTIIERTKELFEILEEFNEYKFIINIFIINYELGNGAKHSLISPKLAISLQ